MEQDHSLVMRVFVEYDIEKFYHISDGKKQFQMTVCILYQVCSLQSAFCTQSAFCNLHFVLTVFPSEVHKTLNDNIRSSLGPQKAKELILTPS